MCSTAADNSLGKWRTGVLRGDICRLDSDRRRIFHRPMFRRDWRLFYAFDLLMINVRKVRRLAQLRCGA
jgi:hypothetical protein